MKEQDYSIPISARPLLTVIWGAVCALILAAPILAAHFCYASTAACYLFFAPICHQIPSRSFSLYGYPFAVCHRCSGIYLGLFIGSFFLYQQIHRHPKARRIWIIAASLPLISDALLQYAGLWSGNAYSRFSTGLLFGVMLSSILSRGIAEVLAQYPRLRRLSVIRLSKEVFHE
jgi:uncharacterized membrane protein